MRNYAFVAGLLVLVALSCGCRPATEPEPNFQPVAGLPLDSLVRRVAIPSAAMHKIFNAYVFLPESYFLDSSAQEYPTVYLLHGYGGNFSNWRDRVPRLANYASHYNFIIVTPEGGLNSWYLDSPLDSLSRFSTYISREAPGYIESQFRTLRSPRHRAISGLSMGGHGALTIALTHPGIFGAAGSMSGVVDLRPFANRWEIARHLGEFIPTTDSLADNHYLYSAIHQVSAVNEWPALIIDCGADDELLKVNRALHHRLVALDVPHTYTERPGGHNWAYWDEAAAYQLLFFDRFFDR